ncbi:CDP-glucose 4,6-dehydratase [bacterium]|nr:CDP-glucose 4,6-dehydratase [bacterium]
MFSDFYKNKKVFITGHTGFKGVWLSLWLKKLGAEVFGYSLEPDTEPSLFNALKMAEKIDKSTIGNILDSETLEKTMEEIKPEIVFHLAAQPLVRLSYSEPKLTYETNVIGTLNVLEAARKVKSVKSFVNVTTDKCYENKETKEPYREEDTLGGYDMYSSSKCCSEILSSSYRRSFLKDGYFLATARAGNVIGGGDWAQDRILPDCIRSINRNEDIILRSPNAIRPWQFVLEPLSGYLLLAQKLFEEGEKYADSFNFGPNENNTLTVKEIAQKVCDLWGSGRVEVKENSELHEAGLLFLNIEKAKKVLGWSPSYSVFEALETTVGWYKHFYNRDNNLFDYTLGQIEDYERKTACAKTN